MMNIYNSLVRYTLYMHSLYTNDINKKKKNSPYLIYNNAKMQFMFN